MCDLLEYEQWNDINIQKHLANYYLKPIISTPPPPARFSGRYLGRRATWPQSWPRPSSRTYSGTQRVTPASPWPGSMSRKGWPPAGILTDDRVMITWGHMENSITSKFEMMIWEWLHGWMMTRSRPYGWIDDLRVTARIKWWPERDHKDKIMTWDRPHGWNNDRKQTARMNGDLRQTSCLKLVTMTDIMCGILTLWVMKKRTDDWCLEDSRLNGDLRQTARMKWWPESKGPYGWMMTLDKPLGWMVT